MPLDYRKSRKTGREPCIPAEPALLAGTIELQRQLIYEHRTGEILHPEEVIRRVPWCVRTDCVQPAHLRAGFTRPNQRLTPRDRAEIARIMRTDTESLNAADLAARYQCSIDTIYRVIRQYQATLDQTDKRRERAKRRDALLATLAMEYDPTQRPTMAPALATNHGVTVTTVFQALTRFKVSKEEPIEARRARILAECDELGLELP